MARTAPRAPPDREQVLETVHAHCPACGGRLRYRYDNRHTVTTLTGLVRLRLRIRRCENPACVRYHRPYRPEAEGALVLPQHEFGLDVIALVGALRYREHQSVPEIHRALRERGVAIAERTVTNLLDRYDELVATTARRRRPAAGGPGRAGAGDPGARRTPAGRRPRGPVGRARVPVGRGPARQEPAVLDGRGPGRAAAPGRRQGRRADRRAWSATASTRSARRSRLALPGVPHQLCQFHYLREAAQPIFEADRHAKKELKKRVRGVRPIERAVEGRDDPEAEAVRGYCAAVRSAITDDGRPPLAASGLQARRPARGGRRQPRPGGGKGGLTRLLRRLRRLVADALDRTRDLWPDIRRAYGWVHRAARILANAAGLEAAAVPAASPGWSPPSAATAPRPASSPVPSTTSSR